MPRRPDTRCPSCKRLHPGTGRCPTCTEQIRGTRQQRGYDANHDRTRAQAIAAASPLTPCARCRHPLGTDYQAAHLDHNDKRTGYIGLSHGAPCPTCRVSCNLSAAGRASH